MQQAQRSLPLWRVVLDSGAVLGSAPFSATHLRTLPVAAQHECARGPERVPSSENTVYRCLSEMATSGHSSLSNPQQLGPVGLARPRRRSKLNLDSIPMLNTKSSCGTSQQEAGPPKNMHWRELLARVNQQTDTSSSVLTDTYRRFHSYLRISLTEKCNLRCTYCMPENGVDLTPSSDLLTSDEIYRLASIFVQEGVDKIRLTGGEPTVRKDFVRISERLGSLAGLQTLAMTTNGIALNRSLDALRDSGMTALNISLDTLQPDRFVEFTRRKGHDRVLAAIHRAAEMGFNVKVNVVLMRGQNDDELVDFVEMTRNLPINVRFIEYMPFDDNAWSRAKMYTYKEMMRDIEARFGVLTRHKDPKGEVAKNFHLAGFKGSVAFITSMTEHFCSDCNRVRLMADGNLKVCLFGASEVSLRDAMRGGASDSDLRKIISAAIKRKKFAHADMDILASTKNRAMIKIGG